MSIEIQKNTLLAPYTSWKVGGEAEFFYLPRSTEFLKEALLWANLNSQPVTIMGGGTNILVSDKGVKGLVICLKDLVGMEEISDQHNFRLKCMAGTLKMKAMRRFLKAELSPALFLSGLPGDVAGGVVMNAGVSEKDVDPKEFVDLVESFSVVRAEGGVCIEKEYKNSDVEWAYRKTSGWQPGVITDVTFSWPFSKKVSGVKEMVKAAQELRASKQPLGEPSCGSVFRNPYSDPNNKEKKSSGYLIEQAGLKGYQYGGAEVSRKHANFIVNKGTSTALDIHCAVSIVKEKVAHMFKVKLEPEFQYIGNWEGLL